MLQSQHHLDSAGLFHFSVCRLITHQRIWPRVSKNGVVSILFCSSFYLSLTRAFPEAGNAVTCVSFLFRHCKCAASSAAPSSSFSTAKFGRFLPDGPTPLCCLSLRWCQRLHGPTVCCLQTEQWCRGRRRTLRFCPTCCLNNTAPGRELPAC